MPLFVIFIFGAVVIGAGAMLSPAWPTAQPRIGLAAALSLAVIVGGALFYAFLFGWNTLVVDYLLFALVTSIFLFGTLSYGQTRAEKRGETLSDHDQGWPGMRDLLLFGVAALMFVIPAYLLPVPLDTDAQGFGYLGLMARLGGDFHTLAPFHPEISYLYAPGFPALIAYLSFQLGQGLHEVQLGVAAVLALMLVLLAYDFGAEFYDKRTGRAMAVAMLGGLGLFTAFMDSHYTSLIALVFAFAFIIYALRFLRDRTLADLLAAGLMMGAVALSHPDTTIILALGFAPWLISMWLGKPRPTVRVWGALVVIVPLVAVAAISPWLLDIADLLGADITSPFPRDPNYWQMMIVYHLPVLPFALIGAVVGLRQRDQAAIFSVGWLILALDWSSFGITERLVPWLPLFRYDYPFSIAWHAPIIPYTILGGFGLLWLWDRLLEQRAGNLLHRAAPAVLVGLMVIGLGAAVFHEEILALSKGRISFYGAFSSHDDVAAMDWLRTNTPTDARVLNHPGPHEADWVPVISERDSVYYRPQPFFQGTEASAAEQETLLAFWENPADTANATLLSEAGIDYVIVPQIVTNPASMEAMFRWRPPFTDQVTMQSAVSDAPYLDLVFDQNGAQVYAVGDVRVATAAP
jgi:hypothetical protein